MSTSPAPLLERNPPATRGSNPAAPKRPGQYLPLFLSEKRILGTLKMIRDPLVEYQLSRGMSKSEIVTFTTLVTSLCSQAYTATLTILVMLWNLVPLFEGFLFFLRFVIDKLIDIFSTKDPKERAVKSIIFGGQLIVSMVIIFLIVGLICMPVWVLSCKLFGKIVGLLTW